MFKDLLSVSHADLAVVIDSHGKMVSQTVYMFNDPETKKVLTEFIDIGGMIPLVKFNNQCEMNYYKIIISSDEFNDLK